MGSHNTIDIIERLKSPPAVLRRGFRVSRKGCGRGSGDAPRALKLILLNRLAGESTENVWHEGGDLYRLLVSDQQIGFTFRVTTARRLAETGRPWFNLSARELAAWKDSSRLLLVAECKKAPSSREFLIRLFVVDPSALPDIGEFDVKPSESRPTALFEVQQDADGYYVHNLTAKANYPNVRIDESRVMELVLTAEESAFLSEAYEVEPDSDHTVGGRFEPLVVTVDPGTAPADEIAEYLADLSNLYRLLSGSGIQFTLTDVRYPALVTSQ